MLDQSNQLFLTDSHYPLPPRHTNTSVTTVSEDDGDFCSLHVIIYSSADLIFYQESCRIQNVCRFIIMLSHLGVFTDVRTINYLITYEEASLLFPCLL